MVEDHRSYCHFGCWEFMSTGLGLEQMLSGSVPKPGGGGAQRTKVLIYCFPLH